ncbi:MAG: hypothetical protein V3U86_09285, partial [Acidobacteriota bacterium]
MRKSPGRRWLVLGIAMTAAAGPDAAAAVTVTPAVAVAVTRQVQEAPAEAAGRILSLLDLAHMEYADAVSDGQIVDAAEYKEATEFTTQAAAELSRL